MRGPGRSRREPDKFEEVQEGGGRLGKLWLWLGEQAGTRASKGLADGNEGFGPPSKRNGRHRWVYPGRAG